MPKLQAQGDFVIAIAMPPDYYNAMAATPGSVVERPDTAKHPLHYAEVISVGAGRTTEFGGTIVPTVKEGDVVLYDVRHVPPIDFYGKVLLMIRMHEVLAVLEDAPTVDELKKTIVLPPGVSMMPEVTL